jgi:hypothetical protein
VIALAVVMAMFVPVAFAVGCWVEHREMRSSIARARRREDIWYGAWRHEHLMRVRLAHELEQERADRVECARVDEVAS